MHQRIGSAIRSRSHSSSTSSGGPSAQRFAHVDARLAAWNRATQRGAAVGGPVAAATEGGSRSTGSSTRGSPVAAAYGVVSRIVSPCHLTPGPGGHCRMCCGSASSRAMEFSAPGTAPFSDDCDDMYEGDGGGAAVGKDPTASRQLRRRSFSFPSIRLEQTDIGGAGAPSSPFDCVDLDDWSHGSPPPAVEYHPLPTDIMRGPAQQSAEARSPPSPRTSPPLDSYPCSKGQPKGHSARVAMAATASWRLGGVDIATECKEATPSFFATTKRSHGSVGALGASTAHALPLAPEKAVSVFHWAAARRILLKKAAQKC
eukprot:TRINITY_DN51822_c0_g2_i1.p1 TRINITY_DN51822_c0_g2~~TRINITY_DN51822_c0_g2_i1.p1  ORF type:complete len:330 (-),score=-22.43 TRINITY_DN51822_c0_g2_i1:87-1031(-)